MKEPTLEKILEVASFGYDEDGKLVVTKLKADIIGNHHGHHYGNHYGDLIGNHQGETYNPNQK